MAVQTYVGSFDSRSGTGTQSITGVGFQPKALIVWGGVGNTTGSGTWWNAVYQSLGFAGSTGGITQFAQGLYSQDSAVANTARSLANAIIVRPLTNAAGANELASLTSFDADGFTITWTTNTDRAHWNFMAIGGSDITGAKVIQWTAAGSGTTQSFTGVGFKPDLVLHTGWGGTGSPGTHGTYYYQQFGAMNKHGQQWANAVMAADAANPSSTSRWQQTDACINFVDNGDSAYAQAHFQSMDNDGFTLYWSTNGSTQKYFSLCLQGVTSKLGAFMSPNAVDGNQTIPTRHNFTVRGALMTGVSLATTNTPAAHACWSLGATDGSNQSAHGFYDLDALATSDADSIWRNDGVVFGTASTTAYAKWVASDNDSITLNWNGTTGGSSLTSREFLYLLIGDANSNTYPSTVNASSQVQADATAYTNQKKMVELSDGKIVALFKGYTGSDYRGYIQWSSDGQTWTSYAGSFISGWSNGSIATYTNASNEYLVAVWKQVGTGGSRIDGYTYAMVGTLTSEGTVLTWGTAVEVGNGYEDGTTRPYLNYPDVVAHAEGSGGQIHVFNSLTNGTVQRVRHHTAPITGTIIGTWTNTSLTGVGSGNLPSPYAAATINPSTKDLYVAWSNGVTGTGNGIRFMRATYAAGPTWTWGSNIQVDPTRFNGGAAVVKPIWDGARVVIGYSGIYNGSSSYYTGFYESTNFTTFTDRVGIHYSGGTDGAHAGGFAVDTGSGDCYWVGRSWSSTVRNVYKWKRSPGVFSIAYTEPLSTNEAEPYSNVLYAGNKMHWVYTHGNNSPYSIKYDYFQLYNPEVGLTLPQDNASEDLAGGHTFKWSYYAPDDEVQTGWAFKHTKSGSSTPQYWNATSTSWQSTEIYNSGTVTQVTFAAGKWEDGMTYDWTVSVRNANGVSGYAPAFTVTDNNTNSNGVQTEVGSFQKQTTTGFQDITIGTDLTNAPDGSWAVIFWSSGATPTVSGTWASNIYGAMVSYIANGGGTISEYCVSASMQNGLATSNTSRHMIAKAISLVDSNGSANKDQANFVGFPSSTKMRLNWTSQAGGFGTQIINYMIISGLTGAKVVNWSHNAVGSKSVTGVGFKPDLVLHAGQEGGGLGTSTATTYFGIGAMNKHGQQWANSFTSEDNVSPSNTSRYQQTDAAFALVGPSQFAATQFHYQSMDSDGFTVYFSNAPYFQYPISLCLKGVSSKLGAFAKTTVAAPTSQVINTRQEFIPKGMFFTSIFDVSYSIPLAGARWMFGATDLTNERAVLVSDNPSANPTAATALWHNDKAIVLGSNGTTTVAADLSSADEDSFTINLTSNGGSAHEILYMALGDPEADTFPARISSAEQPTATAFSNNRRIARFSNGNLLAFPMMYSNTSEPWYSTDGGKTWTSQTSGEYINGGTPLSVFIDEDDYVHIAFKQNNNNGGRTSGYIYYMRGTPNTTRTAVTWSSAVAVRNLTDGNYPDLVVIKEGTGWVAHVVMSVGNGASSSYTVWAQMDITSAGVATLNPAGNVSIGGDYGNAGPNTFPSIDFNPVNKSLYVAWSAGATGTGKGIRFRHALYSNGSWSWDTQREVDPDVYMHSQDNQTSIVCRWDGTNPVIAVMGINGSSQWKRRVYDTTNYFVTPPSIIKDDTVASPGAYGLSMAIDPGTQDIYLFASDYTAASNYYGLVYFKYTRNGASWSAAAFLDYVIAGGGVNGHHPSAFYSNGRIHYIYTTGNNTPYAVKYNYLQLNNAPAVTLTAPADEATVDLNTTAQVFTWSIEDEEGNTQTKYVLRRRKPGHTTYEYWTGSAWSATLTEITSTTASATVTANTWTGSTSWYWSIGVRDSSGESPIGYSEERLITNTAASSTVNTYVGSFTKITTTGNQDITIAPDLTAAPAGSWAVIFWTGGSQAASGTWAGNLWTTIGFVANGGGTISQYAVGATSEDGNATSNSGRRMAAKAICFADKNGGTTTDEADFVGFTSATNMRINWTTQTWGATSVVNYMIITGLSGAKVVNWRTTASAGAKSVTGVGFSPDLVLNASAIASNMPGNHASSIMTFGAMNKHGQQWANSVVSLDNANPSNTSRWQQTDACFVSVSLSETTWHQAHFTSMDADGFSMYFVEAIAAFQAISLCVKGVSSKLGAFTAGSATQSINIRSGFTPKGALFVGDTYGTYTAPQAYAHQYIGASDGTNHRVAAFYDYDNISPTQARSVWRNDAAIFFPESGNADRGYGSITSFDAATNHESGGFTLSWINRGLYNPEVLYLALGDPEVNTTPKTIETSTVSSSTAYSIQRKIAATSDGTLWTVILSASTGNYEFHYSKDDGVTWTHASTSDIDSGTGTATTHRSSSFFIDQDDYANFVYQHCNGSTSGNERTRLVRGSLNSSGTAWSWGTYNELFTGLFLFYDIVAFRDPMNKNRHYVWATAHDESSDDRILAAVFLASGTELGTKTVETVVNNGASSGSKPRFCTVDFNHKGDGKSVDGVPKLFFAWTRNTTGAGHGIRFRTVTYVGGSWSWGTEVEVDNTRMIQSDGSRWHRCRWDGTRVVIGGLYNGIGRDIVSYESTNFTSFTTRAHATALAPELATFSGCMEVDRANGDIYFLGSRTKTGGIGDIIYYKYTRSSNTFGALTVADTFLLDTNPGGWANANYRNGKVEWVYVQGNNSPYAVKYDYIETNSAPVVTLSGPEAGARIDLSVSQEFSWSFTDAEDDTQSAYIFRRRRDGHNTYEYWNAGTSSWSNSSVENSTATTNVTIPSGKFTDGKHYYWSIGVKDSAGSIGWSEERKVTNSNSNGVKVKVGSFAGRNTLGTSVITGLGFKPKAIMFFASTYSGSFGTWQGHIFGTLGMTTGPGNSYSLSWTMRDGVSTPGTSRRNTETAFSMVDFNGGQSTADIQSMDADGFTLNWTNTGTGIPTEILYMAIGGDDISGAKAVVWNDAASNGTDKSVTGVGFSPDLVFHATNMITGAISQAIGGAEFGFGAMNKHGQQWSNAFHSIGANPTNTQRGQRFDSALYTVNTTPASDMAASFKTMDPDGFTMTFWDSGGGTRNIFSLALKGVGSKLGTFVSPTGTVAQSITRVGFQPKALLFSTWGTSMSNSPTTGTQWNLGLATSPNEERVTGFTDAEAVATSMANGIHYSDKSILVGNTGADGSTWALAELTSMDEDGFTHTWTTNSGAGQEILYMALGEADDKSLPATLGTSTYNFATAYSNQRKLDRFSTGRLVAIYNDSNLNSKLKYSDDGVTWFDMQCDIAGAERASMFIDQDDYVHVVWTQNGTGGGRTSNYKYYMRGTPNAAKTTLTWSSTVNYAASASVDYSDVVAHREGSGWKVHIVASYTDATPINYANYYPITISSSGGLTLGSALSLNTSYAVNVHTFPTIDFHHTGDGKTVKDNAPHLFVAWTAGASGAGKGVRFKKATYSNGSWTWGTEREIDTTHYLSDNGDRGMNVMFDGTRVIIPAVVARDGSNDDIMLYERDANDTATVVRTLHNPGGYAGLYKGGRTYDQDGNVYFWGEFYASGFYDSSYRKWNRATGTFEALVTLQKAVAQTRYMSVRRGYYEGKVEWIYTSSVQSPYAVQYDYLSTLDEDEDGNINKWGIIPI